MGLLRYQIFLVYTVGLISLWISLRGQKPFILQIVSSWIPQANTRRQSQNDPYETIISLSIDYAPILFIFGLGVYAFISIAYGVFVLRDCPDASKELEKQIQDARRDLIQRGIIKS